MSVNSDKISGFFVGEYRRMVGYVRRIIEDASDRDSEDIVQDVMAGFFEAADITRPVENLSAYIYRSLRNRVIDIMRSRREHLSLDASDPKTGLSLSECLEDIRYNTEDAVLMEIMRDTLEDSVLNLPDEMKEVFIMTEFEGRSYSEISKMTGIPPGTLLSRKSRAIDRIRADLHLYRNFMEK
ncbi:MAG TPA: RNA polymerase sigma factor [Spirochaetota bacterium]|nr:RNA polymerase sigma factor [Spirochaetota bacterium]